MVADPLRRGNGDRPAPIRLTASRAAWLGIVALTLVSCAKDVQQRANRVAELQLPIPRHTGDAARPPLFQRTSEIQQAPPQVVNRNEAPGNVSKARLPLGTTVSPSLRPRSSEKSNVGPLTPAQRERLFEEFLQWQKRTTIQGEVATIQGEVATAGETDEAPGSPSKARLPPATNVSPSPRARSLEKLNVGSLSSAQKEQLFEGFLEWEKRTAIQTIFAMTDDTNERYAMARNTP